MTKYRVAFQFDKETHASFVKEASDKESLYQTIIDAGEWFRDEDDKGVLHVFNMKNVNQFSINEYKPASVRRY